jgi:enamine deaminase RidA (YjgF/YER057c/UK114 family)
MTITRIDPGARMSQAVSAGGLVFLAGQVAEENAGKDVGTQTAEILGQIDALLARAGTDRSRLVSVTIYLAAIGDFDAMNKVYDGWVDST